MTLTPSLTELIEEVLDEVEPEYQFHPSRRWRFDYALVKEKIAIEAEGGTFIKGRHTTGIGHTNDCEKYNAAALLGWRILRYTRANLNQLVYDLEKIDYRGTRTYTPDELAIEECTRPRSGPLTPKCKTFWIKLQHRFSGDLVAFKEIAKFAQEEGWDYIRAVQWMRQLWTAGLVIRYYYKHKRAWKRTNGGIKYGIHYSWKQ